MLKSTLRRSRDWSFVNLYFRGHGIDIGCGELPFPCGYDLLFPHVSKVDPWDKAQGDAETLVFDDGSPDIAPNSYDFAVSSHCLEHLPSPDIALKNWLRILKPGGYLIVTVPDWEMYERKQWPSRFNTDHKHVFTFSNEEVLRGKYEDGKIPPLIFLPYVLDDELFCEADLELMRTIRDHFDPTQPAYVDQCAGPAECAIEFVLRKR